jgi:D-alanyl-D-alanine carboxypeptidase/D-alanyl-D-alanine-endopeptidase (penicillin-binding protein 4)
MAIRPVLAALAALALAACASVERDVRTAFADPAIEGARFGLVVATLDGHELLAINPDQRFIPASNTKLFTAAAALRLIPGLDRQDEAAGASLRMVEHGDGSPPDLVLAGNGDATMGDGPQCQANCLEQLADAVVTYGFPAVGDIVGDDTIFPDERWGAGWSWNNLETRSGTAVSALAVNNNELAMEVRPGAVGSPAIAAWREGDDLYTLTNDAITIASAEGRATDLWVEHRPNTMTARLYGTIVASDPAQTLRVGIDDPALLAAIRLRRLLEARGVEVHGEARARHRLVQMTDDPAKRAAGAARPQEEEYATELARLVPGALGVDIRDTMKVSQNLHAELFLRRLGLIAGQGSSADGLAAVRAMLADSGADMRYWEVFDGSGMSPYNRVSPRFLARFLSWTQTQPWGEALKAALPVGGVDGTLRRRFVSTPLEGRIFAKTGSLLATNALAGFLTTASGRTLVFAVYVNDAPSQPESGGMPAIDAALVRIAEAY